ncbi:hypothetical protein GcC1_221011 [Golovinomyces cichoracearum]|uniref:Uncharacterized protein n=1 Tax=Golovinomyces cichoracearum TaxID=62708 RepID=A0A420H7P2_9PEZI|nr:hypothetical protein GcC1_221011 [Golovinomyces cichoracearum]
MAFFSIKPGDASVIWTSIYDRYDTAITDIVNSPLFEINQGSEYLVVL